MSACPGGFPDFRGNNTDFCFPISPCLTLDPLGVPVRRWTPLGSLFAVGPPWGPCSFIGALRAAILPAGGGPQWNAALAVRCKVVIPSVDEESRLESVAVKSAIRNPPFDHAQGPEALEGQSAMERGSRLESVGLSFRVPSSAFRVDTGDLAVAVAVVSLSGFRVERIDSGAGMDTLSGGLQGFGPGCKRLWVRRV